MKKKSVYAVAMMLYSLVMGWEGAKSAFAAEAFSGDWEGRWVSDYQGSGGLSVSMTQSGSDVSGRLSIRNTECGNFSNLRLTGNVSGALISIYANAYCAADKSDNRLEFTQGILTDNNLAGIYTVISDGEFYDSGTFDLTRSVNLITASAGPGGTIDPAGVTSVDAGENQTFIISPDEGYRILDVQVDGVSLGARSSYTFRNLSANHFIRATFEIAPSNASVIVPNVLTPLLLEGSR
jgi:hypothetical protein